MEIDRILGDLSAVVEDLRGRKERQTNPPSTVPVRAKVWRGVSGVLPGREEHRREGGQADLPGVDFLEAGRNSARGSSQLQEEDVSPFAAFLKAKKETLRSATTPPANVQTPGPRTVAGCSGRRGTQHTARSNFTGDAENTALGTTGFPPPPTQDVNGLSPTGGSSQPVMTKGVKLPRYNGSSSPEAYFVQVQLAAWRAGWGPEEAAVHLALALEGPALQVLLDLSPTEQRDYLALTAALDRRFGERKTLEQRRDQLTSRQRCSGESLGSLAADVQYYARLGYPQFSTAAQEELALHAFLQALTPEKLRQHVRLSAPRSLMGALMEAERAEAVLFPHNTAMSLRMPQASVRQLEGDDKGSYSDEEKTCQVSSTASRPTQRRSPRRRQQRPIESVECFRCGELGHVARVCPAPVPKPRQAQLSGNEQ